MIICDMSVWEIAMLLQKGHLQVEADPLGFINLLLQANNVHVQAITPHIAILATQVPAAINQDPADRLIAATTLAEHATLITADRNLPAASLIPTVW
jgi:PIN domain nuclease of toxin-antitoxin system